MFQDDIKLQSNSFPIKICILKVTHLHIGYEKLSENKCNAAASFFQRHQQSRNEDLLQSSRSPLQQSAGICACVTETKRSRCYILRKKFILKFKT